MFETREEQIAFERWAFNTSPVGYNMACFLAWNSIHGDKLWLKEDGNIAVDLVKMQELYKQENAIS